MARKRTTVLLIVLLVALAGLTVAGSLIGLKASAQVGGRTIAVESAHVLSPAGVAVQPSGTVVSLGERQVTVTADAVLLPQGASIAIPAGCRRVDLREWNDGIQVLLDGQPAN